MGEFSVSGIQIQLNGSPFIPKGVGLGGALLLEPYFFGSNTAATRHSDYLAAWGWSDVSKAYRESYITKQDIETFYNAGFNCIRIPFHWKQVYHTDEGSDVPILFDFVDTLIAKLETYEASHDTQTMFVLLDMHACPGSQSGNPNISDADTTGVANLYSDDHIINFNNESHTSAEWFLSAWTKISEEYKENDRILGYELINEPICTYITTQTNGFSVYSRRTGQDLTNSENKLRELHQTVINEMRNAGDQKLVMINGDFFASEFGMYFAAPNEKRILGDNIVYAFHTYWTAPIVDIQDNSTAMTSRNVADIRDMYDVPFVNTEFGENSNEWLARYMHAMDESQFGWFFWTNKKWSTTISMHNAQLPSSANVEDYSDSELDSLMQTLQYAKPCYDVQKLLKSGGMHYLTTRQPFEHESTGKLLAANYDYGLGQSNPNAIEFNAETGGFIDSDSMNIANYSPEDVVRQYEYSVLSDKFNVYYNQGLSYRNDAVDIIIHANCPTIGYTRGGEMLHYTLQSAPADNVSWDVLVEYAAPHSDGNITYSDPATLTVNESVLELDRHGDNWAEVNSETRQYDTKLFHGAVAHSDQDVQVKFIASPSNGSAGINVKHILLLDTQGYRNYVLGSASTQSGVHSRLSVKNVLSRRLRTTSL